MVKHPLRLLLVSLALLWPLSEGSHADAGSEKVRDSRRPNVLFIAIDDLRPELGCYGADHIISPNIDALAASGVRFERAYCQQAICGPSRASVLTGLRPDSTRVHGNHTHYRTPSPHVVTLPQYMKQNGYHTRAMGKINHGVFPKGASNTPADSFGDGLSWSLPAFRPGPRYYYTEEGIAAARQVYRRMYEPKDPGPWDWTQKLVFGPATEAPDVEDGVLYDGQVADRAVASLAELSQRKDQPFFLAVGFIKPHSPYIAPKRYWDLYSAADIPIVGPASFPEAPKVALHGSGELRRYTDQPTKGPIADGAQRRIKHAYYACISYIDAQVGHFLDALDEHGLRENTIVVLWSDHGYHLGEQNLWGKTTNFELDTRVPLIVRAPGQPGNGRASTALVELVDLFPTLVGLCGLPVPPVLEGSGFVPLLEDPDRPWKDAAFSQFTRGRVRGYSLRSSTHRYTEWRNLESRAVVARELYEYEPGLYPIEPENRADTAPDLVKVYARRLAAGRGWKSVRRELGQPGVSRLEVDRLFGDHMVLPRNQRVPVWGTAPPGTTVRVRFAQQVVSGLTDRTGRWRVFLEPEPANLRPSPLTVNDRVIEDVLVGDVWLCAGQSNMRWRLEQSRNGRREIDGAGAHPSLRLLDLTAKIYPVRKRYSREDLRRTTESNYYDTSGWQRATGASASTFSAVAWHFGKRLREADPAVPIGLVHSAIGGTPMESWIPEVELLVDPKLQSLVTTPWYRDGHPRYPPWCGQRGRNNLSEYFEHVDGPAPHHPFEPGFLFEAGARPFLRFPLGGVLWYQGESNATTGGANTPAVDAAWNRRLFTTLIRSWRHVASNDTLPFIFAQLPGLNREWAPFREMQRDVALADPHTHMAVTIDVGHPTDVHPRSKQPVGRRLAELALGLAKSPEIVELDPSSVTFDQPVRTRDGKPPRGFVLAGEDRIFRPATATIHGNRVSVRSHQVRDPVAVRHGWADDPDLNLVAVKGGHPVSPFRSDRWATGDSQEAPAESGPTPTFTGFETADSGPLTRAAFDGAIWSAPRGHAVINAELPRTGRRCLQLMGGEHSEITFELSEEWARKKPGHLTFAAERWTRRAPFTFRVEVMTPGGEWEAIYNGDKVVRVGRAYLNSVSIPLPSRARRFRMTCSSPAGTGILIDDMNLVESQPMQIVRVGVLAQTVPVLIGQKNTPLLELEIETAGALSPLRLRSVTFELTEGLEVIEALHFLGQTTSARGRAEFTTDALLEPGVQRFALTGELGPGARLDGFVRVTCASVAVGEQVIPLDVDPPPRKIGVAVRQRGQGGVHTTRIPGITRARSGTLIAVYDNRNRGGGDLPGDIDVGMSRSVDGGRSWEPMRVIMDMGDDPDWRYDGVGDPSILTDTVTGTVWVAATWSHGNRSWRGSGPGMTPEETGQLMLVKSSDDGMTWSPPVNVTPQVKIDPDWRFVLQGPGCGITLTDGTLVFPAQFRGENTPPVNGKPFSTIIYSRDRGETWKIGRGVKIDTTEAQIVQLADESIMINCRDNRGGSRSVYTTRDLGRTWVEHATSRRALPEPVCNAGFLRIEHPVHGPLLLFSNPSTTRGRHHFTLKVSKDEGMTWPEKWHTLYDERPGSGYSVLTSVDDDHIGVLWEGPGELYYLRYSVKELLGRD